jgi:hypothetical protein
MGIQSSRRWAVALGALIAILAMSPGTSAAATAGVQAVVTTGEAVITGNDPAEARRQAIGKACLAAVRQVLTEVLPGETVANHAETIEELVFRHPDAFIQNYRVHTQWQDGDQYRVQIECAVAVDALKARLAEAGVSAAKPAGRRSVLLMLAERNFPQDPPQFWWGPDYLFARAASETAIEKVLTEAGFVVVDHQTRRQEAISDTAAGVGAEPSLEDILRLGRFFAADLVIAGQAEAEMTAPAASGRPATFQGRVRVRAVDVQSGQSIADIQDQAEALAANEITGSQSAIAAAGLQVGQIVVQRLGAAGKPTAGQPRRLTLRVKGIQPLARFLRFRRALGALPGVESFQTREMTATEAILEVGLDGAARDLADAIGRQAFDGFQGRVSDVGEDRIEVELIDPGHLP